MDPTASRDHDSTVASAKFQYQLSKHEEGVKRRGEGAPTSYPKCLHTWQFKWKWYLLISHLENPRTCHERQDLGNTLNGVRLLTQQPCYQFRIALIKSDHMWLIVLYEGQCHFQGYPPLHPILIKYLLIFKACSQALLQWLPQNLCEFCWVLLFPSRILNKLMLKFKRFV